MLLKRLYTNRPDAFVPISFSLGLNVVMGEIRVPENRDKDTHNLGKSTLGLLLDYCMLGGADPSHFLRKNEQFAGFDFFLTVEIHDGSFLTIRRSVSSLKIALKRHSDPDLNLIQSSDDAWDHVGLGERKARSLVDGIANLSGVEGWPYRKGLGFHLRGQDDYRDVFELSRFKGPHSDWKPFVAQLLGFDGMLAASLYRQEIAVADLVQQAQIIQSELHADADISKTEGLILIKQAAVQSRQNELNDLDLKPREADENRLLVETIEVRIAEINELRYYLQLSEQRISAALETTKILFDPDDAERLFGEAGVAFEGQIKRSFEQLIAFNRAITSDRRKVLRKELKDVRNELAQLEIELVELNSSRIAKLEYLRGTDSLDKLKDLSRDLAALQADLSVLQIQRDHLHRLQALRIQIREGNDELSRLRTKIEQNVEIVNTSQDGIFSLIRLQFNEILHKIVDKNAIVQVSPNERSHLEFSAYIVDDQGLQTSEDQGQSYRKLICVAFDLALVRSYLSQRYMRFVYHDGIFESLDDRKKIELLEVMRRYASLGVQQIITLIDSDLPKSGDAFIDPNEIVLTLHDEGKSGRLFRMDSW